MTPRPRHYVALLVCALGWLALHILDAAPVEATIAPVGAAQTAQDAPQDTREAWARDVLAGLGNGQPSAATVKYMEAWHRAEGGTAAFNWINTTQPAAGATDYNSVGVKNYVSYEQGIQATVITLENGYYPRTLHGLQTNAPVVDDGEMGTWGTGGGALRAQLGE